MEKIFNFLNALIQSVVALDEVLADGVSRSRWPIETTLRGIREFIEKASNLPIVHDDIELHILRYVTTQKRFVTLESTVSDIKRLALLPAEFGLVTTEIEAFTSFERGRVTQHLEEWRRLGVADKSVGEIASVAHVKTASANAIEKAQSAASWLSALFGVESAHISDLRDMLKAVSMLQRLPRAVLMFRNAAVTDEENSRAIERAAKTAEALQKLQAAANDRFRLSIAPRLPEIRKAAQILLSYGLLRRILSKSGGEASRLYKILATSTNKRGAAAGQELASLVTTLQAVSDFESDEELKGIAGRSFRGLQTPWKELVTIANWASHVRQGLASKSARSDSIRDLLLKGDIAKLDSLLEFAASPEHSHLCQLLAEITDPPESTLDSIAKASRISAAEVARLVSVSQALRLTDQCKITSLEKACSKLDDLQKVNARLQSQEVEDLLGSPAGPWVGRTSELEATLQFIVSLAAAALPEAVWSWLREDSPQSVVTALQKSEIV